MPFVLPRISVPKGYETNESVRFEEYTTGPDAIEVGQYIQWLRRELELAEHELSLLTGKDTTNEVV